MSSIGPSSAGGGTADKRGYRYESRWTILRGAIPVLSGKADALVVEPPGLLGNGIEFRVIRGGNDEVHQAKRERAQSSWTIGALVAGGVLDALGTHLADPATSAEFVSGTPAKDLQSLARKANTLDSTTWRADLTATEGKAAEDLVSCWGVDEGATHDRLRRLTVHTLDDETLAEIVPLVIGNLVEGDEQDAAELLGGYLADNLHHPLRAEEMWTYLREHGHPPRDAGGQVALSEKMRDLAERYLDGVESARPPSLPLLVRPEVEQIVVELTADTTRRAVAVVGHAGAGKSTILAAVVRELRERGVVVGPLRLDQATPAATAEELGRQPAVGFDGPAARVLSRAAAGERAVLVVDQLDALSMVSGRGELVIDGIRQTLRQAGAAPNLRVLVACRSHDLDHDRRLRDLLTASADSDGTRSEQEPLRVPVGNLGDDHLTPALDALGIRPSAIHPYLLVVVRNPFNLSLLARLVEDARTEGRDLDLSSLKTRLDLLREVDQVFARRIRAVTGAMDYGAAAQDLAERMSESGELSLPVHTSLTDRVPLRDALLSAGALVEEANRYRFFHQAYFEYVYAARHIAAGRTAAELLNDDDQDLIRRGQVRAILALTREADVRAYDRDLRALLAASAIRAHIRATVIDSLGDQAEPIEAEINALREVANAADDPLRFRAAAALTRPGPVRVLAEQGLLSRMAEDIGLLLAGRDASDALFGDLPPHHQLWLLGQAARSLPEEAARAARSLTSTPEGVCVAAPALLQLVFVAGEGAATETAGLFVDLAGALRDLLNSEEADFEEPQLRDALREFYGNVGPMALRNLAVRCPVQAVGALVAWLELAGAVGARTGAAHVFDEAGGSPLPTRSSGEHAFGKMATEAPLIVAARLMPILRAVMEAARLPHGPSPAGSDDRALSLDSAWPIGNPSQRGHVSDELLGALVTGLEGAARHHPTEARPLLDDLAATDLLTAQVTVAAALAEAAPELIDFALDWAAKPTSRGLQRGPTVSWSWGAVLAHIVRVGTSEQRARATDLVLQPYRDLDLAAAASALQTRGEDDLAEWRQAEEQHVAATLVLRAWVEVDLAPPEELQSRVDGLSAFLSPVPDLPVPVIRAGVVRSPIPDAQAREMDDHQWLATMETVNSDNVTFDETGAVGGAFQAAQQVQSLAKADPVRFARLMSQLRPDTNQNYADGILWGIAESTTELDADGLAEIIAAIRAVWSRPDRHPARVCDVIRRLSAFDLPDDVLEMVAWTAAEADDPETETWKESAYSGQPFYGGEITMAGLNCDRGQGVVAIAHLLGDARGTDRLPHLLPAIERAAGDRLEQVRVMVPRALMQLGRLDSESAGRVLRYWLAGASEDCLKADDLPRLAYAIAQHNRELGRKVVERMLGTSIASVRNSAGQVAACLVWRDQETETPDPETNDLLIKSLANLDARSGVAQSVADLVDRMPDDLGGTGEQGSSSIGWSLLLRLLDDEDAAVRGQAGRFAHDLERPLGTYASLMSAIADLRYFDEFASALLFTLRNRASELPDAVLSVCERWVSENNTQAGDMTTRAGGTAMYLIEVVLDVHAKSQPGDAARTRSLDLLDHLIELGVDDVIRQLDVVED